MILVKLETFTVEVVKDTEIAVRDAKRYWEVKAIPVLKGETFQVTLKANKLIDGKIVTSFTYDGHEIIMAGDIRLQDVFKDTRVK